MAFKPWNPDGYTPDASENKISQAFKDKGEQRALKQMNANVLTAGGTAGSGAGLTSGTAGSSSVKTSYNLVYTIDGLIYSLTAVEKQLPSYPNPTEIGVIPGTYATQGTASYCKYLVSVGTDGTAASGAGGIEINQGNFATAAADAKLPDCPENKCAIGYVQVYSGTGVFVPGTTGMNAAYITVTFVDLLTMPTNL